MCFFEVAVTLDDKGDVLHPRRRTAVERRIDQRSDDRPDLRPAVGASCPHRARMLDAQHGTVCIIVDLDIVRPPPEQQWKPIGEKESHHHPEAVGPRFDRAKLGLRPVDGPHDGAHLAATIERIDTNVRG